MTVNDKLNVSFRYYYACDGETNTTTHYNPALDAYKFTHPNCTSISVKVWFPDSRGGEADED